MASKGNKKRRQRQQRRQAGGNGQPKNRRHGAGAGAADGAKKQGTGARPEPAKMRRLVAGNKHYAIGVGGDDGLPNLHTIRSQFGHKALAIFSSQKAARAFYAAAIDTPFGYLGMLDACAAAGVEPPPELAAGEYDLVEVDFGAVAFFSALIDASALFIDPSVDGSSVPIPFKAEFLG